MLGIVLVLFQAGATSARQGVFVRDFVTYNSNQALNFDRPEVARTFYGELKGLGRPAVFGFRAEKGAYLRTRVYIPRLEELSDFRPALALFGPGLPAPTPDQLDRLPFTVPANQGLLLSEETLDLTKTPPPLSSVSEPFTQSDFWEGQQIQRDIPETGTYYLVVFSRIGQGGKYALQVGDKAEVGLKEILGFPVLWSRLHLWFGDWPTAVLVWLVLAAFALYFFYRLLVRPWLMLRRKARFQPLLETLQPEPVQPLSLSNSIKPEIKSEWSGRPSKYAPAPKIKPEE